MNEKNLKCPVCQESGFDREGLRMHLRQRWCKGLAQTPSFVEDHAEDKIIQRDMRREAGTL